ncbi:tyrosine protein phosphatase yvh1 [Thecaphora frezii]
MDEIIPGLWIGGLSSALSIEYLTQAGITHIITCMKQRLPPPPTLLDGRTISPSKMRQVRVDDVEQAPILAHFASCNEFIADVLQEEWVADESQAGSGDGNGDGKDNENNNDKQPTNVPSPSLDQKLAGDENLLVQGRQKRNGRSGHWQTTGSGTVLIHCQAGCSRSVAIAAAYLMHTRRISAHDAVQMIQARRARAQPNAGFMAQLELYEQVGFEIDMRHQAVRRFLMSKTDILNGDSFDDMLLSYYPSPYPSPALSQGLRGLSTVPDSSADAAKDDDDDEAQRTESNSGNADADADTNANGVVANKANTLRSNVGEHASLSCSPTTSSMDDQFAHLSTDGGSAALTSIRQREEVRVTKNSGRLPGGVSSIKGHEGLANRGKLPKPTFSGPKLRCKACRRELAALDHVIEHQEGQGQMAFDHRKREAGNAKYANQTMATNTAAVPGVPGALGGEGSKADEMQRMFGARPAAPRKVVEDETEPGEAPPSTGAAPRNGVSSLSPASTATTAPPSRRIQSATSLSSRLPPHLAALRGSRPAAGTTPTPAPPSAPVQRPAILHSLACSAYFIEPMAWMTQLQDGQVAGKLVCPAPKCASKLGSWDWAGMQCGCGAWVTPAFALHRSKVDEV